MTLVTCWACQFEWHAQETGWIVCPWCGVVVTNIPHQEDVEEKEESEA